MSKDRDLKANECQRKGMSMQGDVKARDVKGPRKRMSKQRDVKTKGWQRKGMAKQRDVKTKGCEM